MYYVSGSVFLWDLCVCANICTSVSTCFLSFFFGSFSSFCFFSLFVLPYSSLVLYYFYFLDVCYLMRKKGHGSGWEGRQTRSGRSWGGEVIIRTYYMKKIRKKRDDAR